MFFYRVGFIIVLKFIITASSKGSRNAKCYSKNVLSSVLGNEATGPEVNVCHKSGSERKYQNYQSYGDGYVTYPENVKIRLLPRGFNETDDRILQQISLKPKVKGVKKILVYKGLEGNPEGSELFVKSECQVTECHLTGDQEEEHVDAVIFDNHVWGLDKFPKKPHQIWVLNLMESPFHTNRLQQLKSKINWTASYRTDSTIVIPYDKFVLNSTNAPMEKKKTNYANGKTKMAAIFVSNCYSYSGRLAYVRELEKYVTVDVYGLCGNMTCERDEMDNCYQLLSDHYKFYLAFENSLCKDYISEKFFWHALKNNIIPVVMGPTYEEYIRVAPPNSFIHVDNFTSPEQLATFMTYLDKNNDAYNKYFEWKDMGGFVDSKFWCRMCSMLHADLPDLWYEDIEYWYKGKHLCRKSTEYDDISLLDVD